MGRHLVRGAGPLLATAVLFGCSTSNDVEPVGAPVDSVDRTEPTSTSSVAADADSPTTVAPTTVAPTTSTAETAPTDARAMLTDGLDGLAGGYHFVTTVTVGEQEALTAEGDRVGDATRMTMSSDGRTIDYVVTPDATWVAESGTWQQLDQIAQSSDPLAPLRAPSAARLGADDGTADDGTSSVLATYPAAALGLAGDGEVEVTIELDGGVITALSYADPSAGGSMVRTAISPLTDTTPVTVPAG